MNYRIFNISLDCDITLPELTRGELTDFVIHVASGSGKPPRCNPDWFHEWRDKNNITSIACGRFDHGFVLRFPDLADFYISCNGDHVTYYAEMDLPVETLRHLLIDQVVPRILGHKGKIVLHASAVHLSGKSIIAFVGDTGWGKSTLASYYRMKGADLVTDDCLLIEPGLDSVHCIPNYGGLRLYEDSLEALSGVNENYGVVAHYSSKKRLILHAGNRANTNPVEIGAIFLLADPDKYAGNSIEITKIQGANELISLIRQLFLLDVANKQVIAEQFNKMQLIIGKLPVFNLRYPHDYAELPAVYDAIETVLDEHAI